MAASSASKVEHSNGSELVRLLPNSTNENSQQKSDKAGRILYLFSGPKRDVDGFGKFCEANGFACTYVDKEFDGADLVDLQTWQDLEATLPNYDGYLLSPPCSTFTPARREGDGGPRPLRTARGPERYGRKDLRAHEKEKVKIGTLLSKRAHDTATHAHRNDKPWVLEQPHWRENSTSMFTLDEFQELLQQDGVKIYTLSQCRYGADVEKLTDLMSNCDLSELELRCNHPSVWWRTPWNGDWHFGPHPPLRGQQKAIRSEDWDESMLRSAEPDGPYLTRAYAAYPKELNEALANAITSVTGKPRDVDTGPDSGERTGRIETGFVRLDQLRPQHQRKEAPSDMWSLRNVYKSINGKMRLIGKQIANLIERELDSNPLVEEQIMANVGKPANEVEIPEEWCNSLRTKLAQLFQRNRNEDMCDICLTESVVNKNYQTSIRAHLLEYWANLVEDPAARAAKWLYEGAPAGLQHKVDLQGICAEVEDEPPELDDLALSTDLSSFENYDGVEANEDAAAAIQGYVDKGYLKQFDTYDDVANYLGAKPTLSKLGCIVKDKVNYETGMVTKKTRIMLDCKQSQVSKFASRTHKSVLPRVSDAVHSMLQLMGAAHHQESVTLFIADVSDAFWLVPLHVDERKYFVAKFRMKYYVFVRTAQGSRGAPLTFAVIMALAARFVQSILCGPCRGGHHPEAMLQIYVDDPLAVLLGTEIRQKRLACMISAAWMVLGVPLAFHKAILSSSTMWIGVNINIDENEVMVEVPSDKVSELKQLVGDALIENVISVKVLRTIIGKCMAVASVIYVWRPFIQEIYAALHGPTNAPNGCIWMKQIKHSMLWLLAFLNNEAGSIRRIYGLAQYMDAGTDVQITWDASPYGMGAYITEKGKVIEFFAIPISSDDQQTMGVQSGGCEGQQTWECLVGLIAMRQWAPRWKHSRVRLHLRGDNIASLVLFSTLKTHSKQLSLIAREFALDLGTAAFRPELVQHVPGISNVVADQLSRRYEPGKKFELHSSLHRARAIIPPPRTGSWWRTLAGPPMPVTPLAESRAWGQKRAIGSAK